MSESSSSSKNLLPDGMKLIGEENYTVWKEAIEDIAVVNGLRRYIYKKGKAPEYIDEFNKKANKTKLAVQQIQEAGDLGIKIIIKLNIKSTLVQMLAGYKLVCEIQVTLQTQYKGTGAVLNYNAIKLYMKIKYNNYLDLEYFIIAFKKAIEKLVNLDISLLELWHLILFIMALSNVWPIQAEQQQLNF